MAKARRILILGGTGQARELADLIAGLPGLTPVTSLAGRTAKPILPQGEIRSGGFGGVAGLAAYLRENGVALVADATHPFAATMSAHAAEACAQEAVPYLRLERPGWERQDEDNWREAHDIAAAAAMIEAGARALVTVGRQEIAPFLARSDISVFARMIEPLQDPAPGHAEIILARPPFSLEEELALMREKEISVLVAKNSGGAGYAKLIAARMLFLPVVLVARPQKPQAPLAASAEEMRDLILASLPRLPA